MKSLHMRAGKLLAIAVMAALPAVSFQAGAQDAQSFTALDQGWWGKGDTQKLWYGATQGSRLIPLDWLRSLEQPGLAAPFLDPAHTQSFGYLPNEFATEKDLPIGFVIDTGPDNDLVRTKLRWKGPAQGPNEKWVGLTCAACHTTQIKINDRVLHIDGAPSTSNFQVFIKTLNLALVRTREDGAKWNRFAQGVLGNAATPANTEQLKKEFDRVLAWQLNEAAVNTEQDPGPGRVDAIGHIFNKVAMVLRPDTKGNPADAPVSIPYIWWAPRFDKIQYNGMVPKRTPVGDFDVGALGRNVGEVIGVFGDVVPHKNPKLLDGFRSSIKVDNIAGHENLLATLRPPKWPAALFPDATTPAQLAHGKDLFDRNCVSCHGVPDLDRPGLNKVVDRIAPPARIGSTVFPLWQGSTGAPTADNTLYGKIPSPTGTDPWMACNAFGFRADPGDLRGFGTSPADESGQVQLSGLLQDTVVATLYDHKGATVKNLVLDLFGIKPKPTIEGAAGAPAAPAAPQVVLTEKQRRLQACKNGRDPNLGYVARQLNGVWATAPYLHNGSVPTMDDLLKPASQRPTKFGLGTRDYDPAKLGFRTDAGDNYYVFDTTEDGNSNAGHDYGNAAFSAEDRAALIAYLKEL